jgi:hypothetical protein
LGKPRPNLKTLPRSLLSKGSPPPGTVPRDGLRLWLRSDQGVKADGGRVSVWEDQSGNGFGATAEGQQRPTLATDAAQLGLPAIRFDGQSQYLRPTNGLNINLPGPFTLVVVATVKDRWPKAIFSPVPEENQNDYESPGSFAFHCTHGSAGNGAFGLVQGLGRDHNLGLTAPCNQTGRPETVVIIRPSAPGGTAGMYLDGQLTDLDEPSGTTAQVKQTKGYVIGSRWPINGNFFGRNDVYEILVYDRVLSGAELQSLHQYLLAPRAP